MPSSGGMTWDAAADRKLLLGILKLHTVNIDYDAMAKHMTTDADKCTVSSIKNRLKRLRAMAKAENIGGSAESLTMLPTPSKRKNDSSAKSSSPNKKPKAPKWLKETADASNEEMDDEEGSKADVKREINSDEEWGLGV